MTSSDWEKRSWNQLQGVWGKRSGGDAAAAAVRDSSVNDDDDDDESVSKFYPTLNAPEITQSPDDSIRKLFISHPAKKKVAFSFCLFTDQKTKCNFTNDCHLV